MSAPALNIPVREQTSWSMNASTYTKILDNLRANAHFYYSPSSITLQGERGANYSLGVSFNYSLLEDKLNINLGFRDLIFPDNSE